MGMRIRQPSAIDIALIGFNDLHGNLEPPRLSINAPGPAGTSGPVAVPAGGVAYLAGAIATLKAANPHHAVISAGDMVGASPLVSALFLDEPTIDAVNRMQIDFNAVGNHEFDKGWREQSAPEQAHTPAPGGAPRGRTSSSSPFMKAAAPRPP